MAAKVFVLRKPAKCADCGKELPAGTQVRGYPLPNGGWKIYCMKHTGNGGGAKEGTQGTVQDCFQQEGAQQPAGSPKPEGTASAESWDEVLERLKKVEAKLDRLLSLLEKKGENASPTPAG